MKKYLLLIEDEELWGRFKKSIEKDINTEIIELVKKKVKVEDNTNSSKRGRVKGGKNGK